MCTYICVAGFMSCAQIE